MPEKNEEQEEADKECKSPPSKFKSKSIQPLDKFKRLMALVEIN